VTPSGFSSMGAEGRDDGGDSRFFRILERYLPIYTVSLPETQLTSAILYWMLNSPLRLSLFSIVIVHLFLHVCVKKAQFPCKPNIKTSAVPEVS